MKCCADETYDQLTKLFLLMVVAVNLNELLNLVILSCYTENKAHIQLHKMWEKICLNYDVTRLFRIREKSQGYINHRFAAHIDTDTEMHSYAPQPLLDMYSPHTDTQTHSHTNRHTHPFTYNIHHSPSPFTFLFVCCMMGFCFCFVFVL